MALRLLLFLAIAALLYFAGRRWWIEKEAAKLTEVLEEVPGSMPYFPKERTYKDLSGEQKQQLETIAPSPVLMEGATPCRVTLDDGTEHACVLIAPAQRYIESVWKWPEDLATDDPDPAQIDIERVVRIEESLYRVPPSIAEQILERDVPDHGGMQFVAEFKTGDRWRYKLHDVPEFLSAPTNLSFADVVAITGRDENTWKLPKGRALQYRWCLYGHGKPLENIRIWKRLQT